ncbi:uncharacterized protein LOC133792024 [Humulus lupulus]|uniref:uncharacterized protein LOC133792024 n=1 Tax=Humulus lupulus TaxID=3486 RepID=UPI002B40E149|nr:uncharacterized protein LOC133792024 [Humulus lupulus]
MVLDDIPVKDPPYFHDTAEYDPYGYDPYVNDDHVANAADLGGPDIRADLLTQRVFTDLVKKRGLDSKFKIDSAGTINYHEGNPADPRMRASSKSRGIVITSLSRPIRSFDFVDFDLSLAMDNQNRDDIIEAFNRWKFRDTLPEDDHKKNYGAFLEKDGAGFRGQVKLTGF